MKKFYYSIGEVSLTLSSLEKEKICDICPTQESRDTENLLFLCPSQETDGELLFLKNAPHLTVEALCASAYHLTATRGLPLYEYTFMIDGKRYAVKVDTQNNIRINIGKCKQLYSNIEISNEKYNLFVNVYALPFACVTLAVDFVDNIDPTAFCCLLMREEKTRNLPFVLYEKGREPLHFRAFSQTATPLENALSFYSVVATECIGKNGKLSLMDSELTFTQNGICMKVSPKRRMPLD